MYKFMEPSSEALKAVEENNLFKKVHDFPWAEVPILKSFAVEKDQIKNVALLRTMASREGIRLGRFFRVVDHGAQYEVCYLRNRPEGPKPVSPSKRGRPSKAVPVGTDTKALTHLDYKCPDCGEINADMPVDVFVIPHLTNDKLLVAECPVCEAKNEIDRSLVYKVQP